MSDRSRDVSYKAILWFMKYAMAIGFVPSMFLLLFLQLKLAILSYATLGLIVGIWTVQKAFNAQMVVVENLGITRNTLYAYTATGHVSISLISFLMVYFIS